MSISSGKNQYWSGLNSNTGQFILTESGNFLNIKKYIAKRDDNEE
jgi:hypothetical protein